MILIFHRPVSQPGHVLTAMKEAPEGKLDQSKSQSKPKSRLWKYISLLMGGTTS